ncbi:alkylhydroperoxidase AhpD family core domain-containing protein [Streptomyces zhaozhouensis]|uniref:Alkylhydroperoxidase AhpD family core domain-containing protein n=1 Tax=Streptomyces zhaozhouensis TaxID=1300267 RepID=A0A286E671_9ACTN|nr:carboxymuconolactone decarboxylase family protein [Streptomyces zhaozhouensis]SOD66400.1 alkylhydroperoxidase AhpD family core domain-containing protein [Streptomyces zhaozhouensis]
MRPFLDKVMPEAWRAATAFSSAIREAALQRGLSSREVEFIKLRASQINACAFCVDLHSREARKAGIAQQQLDLLPAWRETALFDERQRAVLAVAEAATTLPLTEEAEADLAGARSVLDEEAFAAAEWVAVTINAFNRVSILSGHPVRPRDAEGKIVR